MEFKVRCFHSDSNENVIGVEVVAYDGNDEIDKIILVSSEQLTTLINQIESIEDKFIDSGELLDILSNTEQKTNINAKLFNGMASDVFLKKNDVSNYLFKPDKHASTKTEYGIGSSSEYGHLKVIDNLNTSYPTSGEALSAHQGYELNKDLTDLKNNSLKSSLRVLVGKWSQKDDDTKNGEYGTRIQVQPSGDGIYARVLCDLPNFDYKKLDIFIDFNGTSYYFNSSNSDANRKIYSENDGTATTGRLGVNQQAGTDFIVSVFAKYAGNEVYPTTTIKRVEVL